MSADVGVRTSWERLALLLDDDEHLRPRVLEAFDQDQDPWEALGDGLDDAGALAYLHADDSGMELADALAQLPRVFRLQLDLGAVTDTDTLADAAALADELLARNGFRLVQLPDDDQDAHALVVVPEVNLPEIRALSIELAGPVTTFD